MAVSQIKNRNNNVIATQKNRIRHTHRPALIHPPLMMDALLEMPKVQSHPSERLLKTFFAVNTAARHFAGESKGGILCISFFSFSQRDKKNATTTATY